jgi:hypothetical protein
MAIGDPIGADLASGTTNGNTLPEYGSWEEREITLGAGVALTSGTKYAIVVSIPNVIGAAELAWSFRIDNPVANGDAYESSDSGSSWAISADDDAWFKTKASAVEKDDGSFAADGFNRWAEVYGTTWIAQTFTASSSYTLTSVVLKLAKYTVFGGTPETVDIAIKATEAAPAPSSWNFDDGWHFDQSNAAEIVGEMEVEMDFLLIHRPFLDLEVEMEMDVDVDWVHAVDLDLLRLIPEKHHQEQILLDYVDVVELEVGSWLTSVRELVKLGNPNSVADLDFLKNLAQLIGLSLPPEDETTEDEIRRSIAQAIDWYKIKGTYESIQVIALIQKFAVNLFDMYTNDYVNFILTEWFVGEENENPPGFDSSYYKSPHFGIEVLLNQVYSASSGGGSGASGSSAASDSGPSANLWEVDYLDNFASLVEQTRPVHTVPHYILFLNPKTDELGHVIEVDGNIQTRVFADWEFTTKYFDMDSDGSPWYFDESSFFDESITSFLYSIDTWYLGTGEGSISSDSWTPVSPVLTGSIDVADIVIEEEKTSISFIVPRAVEQDGIRELALYTTEGKLVLGSVFPSIDKGSRVELKITVEIYKEDLSS